MHSDFERTGWIVETDRERGKGQHESATKLGQELYEVLSKTNQIEMFSLAFF